MNHKFKMRQRVTALCMAAMMCCGMLPYGALAEDGARPVVVATPEQAATQEAKSGSDANSTATPETADESPDEDAPQQEPKTEGDTGGSDELYEIWHKMYPSLTQEPTGYYLDSYGLPVLVGETKISIEGWGNEDYSSVSDDSFQQVALDAALLNADSTTAAFPHMDGEDYAIVPISMQVMYPANGSSADITLPDNVELLGYSFTSGDLTPATEEERQSQLHYEFSEISASVAGIYVKASEDFCVTMTYTDATQTLTKTVHVTLDDSAPVPGILQDRFAQEMQVAMCSADEGIATYAGLQVTQCVNTSVGWMNYLGGQPALCGDRGKWAWGPGATYKNKYPPVANYTPAGQVWVEAEYFNKGWVPDQATLWSKGFNNGAPAVASLALDAADNATDNYLALLSWQAEQYPDSIAAEIVNAPEAYAAPTGKTVYVGTLYTPSNAAWQRFVVLNYTPVVLSGDSEIPGFETGGESVDKPWSASYERSESLDFSYTVNTDKIQLDTLEKVDGAGIEIAPILDGIPADIDGGSWTITPDGMQSVTTSGHTADDNYHLNGGDGSVTWTVHFSVSKSASQSGSITANSEQDADAQASAAQSAAQSACEGQVNGEIEAALSAAHNYFDNLKFSYNEVTVPHGFDAFGSDLGSSQTITVPANSSNDYLMKNDEWSVKVAIDKIDSETKQRIKGDAAFKIYEWDTVLQRYIPAGGYNQYAVERQPDGTYKVINHSSYANGSDNIYYTQRNEGRFVVVESRAPSGYYGDWTDVTNPGAAGSVLGKRAYAFEITKALDGQTLWLGNADYNADITTTNNGGTLIDTGEAIVTITFGDRATDKTYDTDPTGIANNEKSYTMHADGDKMQNDRVLGSILLTKVDLDAARYLAAGSNGDTTLEGAVYDLYAADTIAHPDGVTGTVDYSKILDANGNPIWHTTVLTNGGWDTDYLPILQKDRLVASAAIKDGKLAFSNLYMGRYYLVERATGLVLPIDGNGKLYTTGKYPQLNKKLERTGKYSDLVRKNNEYADYLYKNQYSAVAESRKLDGSKAWDGYYLSYATGYLCDEVNHYKTLTYADESSYHISAEQESQDEVLKSGFSLNKLVSTTGQPSPALKLEGAGFTVYRISKLSKEAQFTTNPDGSYNAQSILDVYRKDNYDNLTLKYDFTAEGQAVANMYESNAATVEAYNATLTADGDYANGKGNGWVPTDQDTEYWLTELYTNEEGVIRIEGLPYGQYLVVETTLPKDVFQCDPFIVTVSKDRPQSRFTVPAGSVTTATNNYIIERLNLLHGITRPEEVMAFSYDWLLAEDSITTKDFIAPSGYNWKPEHDDSRAVYNDRYQFGEYHGKVLYLRDIAPQMKDNLLSLLSDLDFDNAISIHVDAVEQREAVEQVQKQLAYMQKEKGDGMVNAVRMNLPAYMGVRYELTNQIEDAEELLDNLHNYNQKIFKVCILIHTYGRNNAELDERVQQICNTVQQQTCRFSPIPFEQCAAMNSVLPLGKKWLALERTLLTVNTAIYVPFTTQELFQPGGLYEGTNARSKNLIMVNRKLLPAPAGMVLGMTGFGKSFAVMQMMAGIMLRWPEDDLVIIDPENEYVRLVEAFGGEVIEISASSKSHINPMDISGDYGDEGNPIQLKSQFLRDFCQLVLNSKELSAQECSLVDRAALITYQKYLLHPEREQMPSLHDFYNNLSLQGSQAKALTMALSMYVDGTMDLFAHQTNVDLQNHCICFNTVKLGKSMQSIGMMTVLDQIWNRITRNRVLGRRTWIFTDEFQLLLGNSACTNYYFELSSRARKWGAILTSITQHVRSVLNNEDARRMLSDCGYIKLLNQAPDDANDIARLLHISDEEKRYIENAEVGSGLLIADKVVVPFNNTFPQDTELFRLMDTNPESK